MCTACLVLGNSIREKFKTSDWSTEEFTTSDEKIADALFDAFAAYADMGDDEIDLIKQLPQIIADALEDL